MRKYHDNVLDMAGEPVTNATVSVTDYPSGTASTIYATNGGSAISGNSVTTDGRGYFEFYAANGRYSLTISGTGITTYSIYDIEFHDPEDYLSVDSFDIGDYGLEEDGVNINGVTYSTKLRVNDIGGTNPAQLMLHRHSTTLGSVIIGSRSNTNDSTHAAVTAAMGLLTLYGVGHTGSHYDIFAAIDLVASSGGSISGTSSPGRINFYTTPTGSNALGLAAAIDQDKSTTLYGTLTASNGGSLTGTWSDLGTVTTVDINGGTLDGVTIGASSAPTVTNLGSVATCDINGGTIDGTTIGGTTPAAGSFTTLEAGISAIIGSTSVSPDGTLHVHTASAGSVTATSNYNDLVVENSSTAGMSILGPDASYNGFNIGSPSDSTGLQILWRYSVSQALIATGASGGYIVFAAGTGGDYAAQLDSDSTSGNTRLYVYDVDNAGLARVSVGAADSGGGGYKVLRIPN